MASENMNSDSSATISQKHRLLLLAHGSRDARWRQPFESLLAQAAETQEGQPLDLAYMEMCAPSLLDAAEKAVQDGVKKLSVLPLFMSAGGHVLHDIPMLADQAMMAYPQLQVDILPPIGEHPALVNAMLSIIQSYLSQ